MLRIVVFLGFKVFKYDYFNMFSWSKSAQVSFVDKLEKNSFKNYKLKINI